MPIQLKDYLEDALDRVAHDSSVEAFYHRFMAIQSLLAEAHPEIPEAYFATRFVYGLLPDFQKYIIRFNPTTVMAAYRLANVFEESIYLDYFPENELSNDDLSSVGEGVLGEDFFSESTIDVEIAEAKQGQEDPKDVRVVDSVVIPQRQDTPESLAIVAEQHGNIIFANVVQQQNLSTNEGLHTGFPRDLVQLPVARVVRIDEESRGQSTSLEDTNNQELAMLLIKELKVHPTDMYPTSVDFSLSSKIYVLVHNNLGMHQLNQSENLPVFQTVQAFSCMQLSFLSTESNQGSSYLDLLGLIALSWQNDKMELFFHKNIADFTMVSTLSNRKQVETLFGGCLVFQENPLVEGVVHCLKDLPTSASELLVAFASAHVAQHGICALVDDVNENNQRLLYLQVSRVLYHCIATTVLCINLRSGNTTLLQSRMRWIRMFSSWCSESNHVLAYENTAGILLGFILVLNALTILCYDPGLACISAMVPTMNELCGGSEVHCLCTHNILHVKNHPPQIVRLMDCHSSQLLSATKIWFQAISKIGKVGTVPVYIVETGVIMPGGIVNIKMDKCSSKNHEKASKFIACYVMMVQTMPIEGGNFSEYIFLGLFVVCDMCHIAASGVVKSLEKKSATGARNHAICWPCSHPLSYSMAAHSYPSRQCMYAVRLSICFDPGGNNSPSVVALQCLVFPIRYTRVNRFTFYCSIDIASPLIWLQLWIRRMLCLCNSSWRGIFASIRGYKSGGIYWYRPATRYLHPLSPENLLATPCSHWYKQQYCCSNLLTGSQIVLYGSGKVFTSIASSSTANLISRTLIRVYTSPREQALNSEALDSYCWRNFTMTKAYLPIEITSASRRHVENIRDEQVTNASTESSFNVPGEYIFDLLQCVDYRMKGAAVSINVLLNTNFYNVEGSSQSINTEKIVSGLTIVQPTISSIAVYKPVQDLFLLDATPLYTSLVRNIIFPQFSAQPVGPFRVSLVGHVLWSWYNALHVAYRKENDCPSTALTVFRVLLCAHDQGGSSTDSETSRGMYMKAVMGGNESGSEHSPGYASNFNTAYDKIADKKATIVGEETVLIWDPGGDKLHVLLPIINNVTRLSRHTGSSVLKDIKSHTSLTRVGFEADDIELFRTGIESIAKRSEELVVKLSRGVNTVGIRATTTLPLTEMSKVIYFLMLCTPKLYYCYHNPRTRVLKWKYYTKPFHYMSVLVELLVGYGQAAPLHFFLCIFLTVISGLLMSHLWWLLGREIYTLLFIALEDKVVLKEWRLS